MTAYPFALGDHYQAVMDDSFAKEWEITRGDGQPDSETITLPNGKRYKRTFEYNAGDVMITRSEWVRQ